SKINDRNDAVATADNILHNEFLFRTCIVVTLAEAIVFLFLVFVLYRLFKQVNNHQTRLMVALVGVQIPITFVLAAFKITSLMILKGEISTAFSPGQLPEQAMLFLKMNEYGMLTLELLSGLWLLPFGMLAYKSRFIPRILGILLLLAGIGYTIDSLTFMLFPHYHDQTKTLAFIFSGLGEISIMLWLLIKGVKDHISIQVVSEMRTTVRTPAIKTKEFRE
ncbi:MAG: DUF4386 domain-containing protein, partial [Flavisolibacter sp.]|nr:DUF4386 domain-containing protein [Flavisolibacter sp.]